MSKGSFRQALDDADRALAAIELSPARDRAIRAALAAPRRMRWHVPVLAFAGALAVTAAIVIALWPAPAPTLTAFDPHLPALDWRIDDNVIEVLAPTHAFDAAGFGRITAARGARFVREPGGVRVVAGHVEFQITHRAHAPAYVYVSHGTIAVMGTRFTVVQHAGGGTVTLHEGKIRFSAGDRTVELAPGQSLAWPLPPPQDRPAAIKTAVHAAHVAEPAPHAAEPAPHAAEPAPHAAPATPAAPHAYDIDSLLGELATLRARGRYADAVAFLERTLAEPLPAETLERLSYELGAIETYQLARRDAACRQWHVHRERFPHGRYGDEIEAAVRRLGCKETP